MYEVKAKKRSAEKVVVAGIHKRGATSWEVNDNLDELEQLVHTAGGVAEDRVVQDRGAPNAATLVSKGKVEEIKNIVISAEIDLVVFDDDLSPAQVRNLEKRLECKVIDRSGLILDIFAKRAQSKEARIQVELAQLQYLLPRLTRQWQHLSRQVGGIGTRGPGETQLEVDRRIISERIANLKRQLQKVERSRSTRRKRRQDLFKVALVGYTNAGKSTVLNALTKSTVFVEDLLFATLDPTVRAMRLPTGKRALLIDTVGFIRKLPVSLFESFRSTLEETLTAELLVNIVDLSHPHWEEHLSRTDEIIRDLNLHDTPQILVFNKVDLVDDPVLLEGLNRQFPEALFISALRGVRLWELPQKIAEFAEIKWSHGRKAFSPEKTDELQEFEKDVKVLGRTFKDGNIIVEFLAPVNKDADEADSD